MERNVLLAKYIGCLLGMAIGDALGMATEQKACRAKADPVTDYEDGYFEAGHYTDDTSQAIILAESLLENSGFNRREYIRSLIQDTEFERGIGNNLRRSLEDLCSGKVPRKPTFPSNGLAMKIAPVALLYTKELEAIDDVVEKIGGITHNNQICIAGAVAITQSVAYVLKGGDAQSLVDSIAPNVARFDPTLAYILSSGRIREEPSCHVYATVPNAILTFVDDPNNFESGVLTLVNSEGDTDTKAAMFGAISGAYNGLRAIPQRWIDGLENGRKGKDYIVNLAEKLYVANL